MLVTVNNRLKFEIKIVHDLSCHPTLIVLFMNMHMLTVVGVEFMVAISAPFYCQLCYSFSSNINEAQWHLLSADHNEKYKVCLLLI